MAKKILCFGEILWDCLPTGLFLGGAPLNVASHLRRLNAEPIVISSVGADILGEEALSRIRKRGLTITEITVIEGVPTGTAHVDLDKEGVASYRFPEPCAWDAIPREDAITIAREVDAIVFGTLAARSESNEETLEALLAMEGPMKIMDVNIREPHFDRLTTIVLAQKADLIKINDEELETITGMDVSKDIPEGPLQQMSTLTGVRKICLTRGEDGAIFWDHGTITLADAPKIDVKDTVGAGDAFTAAITLASLEGKAANEFLSYACKLGALVASRDGAVPDYDPSLI